MAEFPALMLWTDAYLADTTHLSTIEHGAYLLLLMAMWRSKTTSLPNDPELLARYAKLTSGQWQRVWPSIQSFFNVDGNSITQGRLTREAEAVRQKSKSNSAAANARWLKDNKSSDADAVRTQCQNDAIHNHNHIHKKKEQKAGSRDPEFVEWYSAYPLKKAPEAAEKAYHRARRRGATHEQLLAGAKRYAAEMKDTEPRFIAYPATWLNAGRWQDEGLTATVTQMDPGARQKARLDSIASCILKGFTNNLSATDADLAVLVGEGRITEDQARMAGWSGPRRVA